ncbi:MAG: class I tRNA ligase family protein, partial [Acidimicrobiia bacterium]
MSENRSAFTRVTPGVDIPAMEQGVLALWRETDAFAESVRRRPADNEYIFYDGPPFPTGSPHYGNLLAGVIKDMVPRYWTMRGYRVERRFGWDTHGLPIEMEVEKRLGISGPRAIAEYGVGRFNEAARSVVQANTEKWEVLTERIGRWVDFE